MNLYVPALVGWGTEPASQYLPLTTTSLILQIPFPKPKFLFK
ncbi:hypothetical protein LEP1GSC199_4041 [Leptospira vanthielii serovar Holland str. Waz Holland = ATCC 700522]|uniref:Uncharacterized protein n=1 Tax=Leptospira vanthielii serovar Holland str. Waz Holland = ATCC 700522 TaxID=1218591 RepID=N1WFW2_9LEPT|nr:hypothetical protein LEP1GSC199_4041 [Leptospira vanthielii serovar Holland str. Waz Holland = ATCC 700522]